ERGQLAHRTRLGILEKHKDYVLRARDYHSKQDRIHRLKEKAATRNQDEFYFGMVNQRTKDGVHVQERGNAVMPVDIVKVLKTQDGNYIRTVRAAGAKKIDALKTELGAITDLPAGDEWEDEDLSSQEKRALQEAGLLPGASGSKKRKRAGPKHLVFVESEEQARSLATPAAPSAPVAQAEQADEAMDAADDLGWAIETKKKRKRDVVPTSSSTSQSAGGEDDDEDTSKPKRHRSQVIKELAARLTRDRSLKFAERELEMQKLLMGKGAAKKLRGLEKDGAGKRDEDDEDDFDVPGKRSRKGKKQVKMTPEEEAAWKPRVYKWKFDRKR
ncbi:small-subunit processome, partial [Exidia glandulosa HHB12029]